MDISFLSALQRHIAGFPSKRRFWATHGEHTALGFLILLVSSISLVWILQDTRPQPGADPRQYLIKTFEFVDELNDLGGTQLWRSVTGMSIQGRPPLYQLLSVPFIYLFGRSEDAALSVNFVFQIILLLSTYGIGQEVRNGRAGLLAAFLVAAYPPIVNLSRIYRPHSAVPACVALSLWLLFRVLRTRSFKLAWLLGASLGLGTLIHVNFIYLMPAPAILFGVYVVLFQAHPRTPTSLRETPHWLLSKVRDPLVLFGLVPAALIAVGLAAIWYVPQRQTILALQQAVAANWVGEAYGFPDVRPSPWWYALTMPGALSNVLAALLGVGLVVCTVERRSGALRLPITFLVMYGALVLRLGDFAWLHFAPVLPVAASLTAVGLVDLGSWLGSSRIGAYGRAFAILLILVCVGVSTLTFSIVTWGSQPWSQRFAVALGSPLHTRTCLQRMALAFCPNPARHEDWRVSDILRTVLDDPYCQEQGCHLTVVPKHDSFGPFTFELYLVRDFPEFRAKIEVSSADGWAGIPGDGEWVVSDYIIYVSHPLAIGTDRGRDTRRAVTRFLESPPPIFASAHQEAASFALPDGWTAQLLKRSEPLTVDMTIQSYEEALRQVPSDTALYRRLGHLYLRTGNESGAEQVFQQASRIAPSLGWPHYALAYLYQQQGLEDRAIAEYQEAIRQEPFDQNAYRSLADLFQAQGRLQQAIQVYRMAAQSNPHSTWPLVELGSLYVRDAQLPQAAAAYQAVASVAPGSLAVPTRREDVYWSLSSGLGNVEAYADHGPLAFSLNGEWVRPYPYDPNVLVGRSLEAVDGLTRLGQIQVHPFGADQATYLRYTVQDCHSDAVQIGYGLADQVAGLSNGVRYTVRVGIDNGRSFDVLLDENVADSVWLAQTLPLVAYWGQDITFELGVDALGNDSYDWLQTTLYLLPAMQSWDLATNLGVSQVLVGDTPLSWNGSNAWQDAEGRSLVESLQAPVQGFAQDNQIQFHPFSSDRDTILIFAIKDSPYSVLRTAYALADEANGHSNGVDYTIELSTDGGQAYVDLLQANVLQNVWTTEMFDLSDHLHRDLTIKMVSSSRGNESFDWLQITLDLIATRDIGR